MSSSTYAEERRAKLVAILGDRSTPREQRIERVARFVEDEVRSAFSRGVRRSRVEKARPASPAAPGAAVLIEDDEL